MGLVGTVGTNSYVKQKTIFLFIFLPVKFPGKCEW